MFKKLTFELRNKNNLDSFKGDPITVYGKISYFKLKRSYQLIPSALFALNPDSIHWAEIDPGQVDPHTDSGTNASLNIYIDPGSAVTRVFEPKPNAEYWIPPTDQVLSNLNLEAKSYSLEDLNLVDQFRAEPFDVYLLDVSQIHDVIEVVQPRTMIQIHFRKKSFQQVLEELEKIGIK